MDAWAYRNGVKLCSAAREHRRTTATEIFNEARDEAQHLFTTIKDAKDAGPWKSTTTRTVHSQRAGELPAEYERLQTNRKLRENHS